MKKLTKEQIEKRNRIKQYLLRSLHIVSYVLSALFIIVCIAVGVQSCNSKNKQQSVSKNKFSEINNITDVYLNYYVYDLKLQTGTYGVNDLDYVVAPNIDKTLHSINLNDAPLPDIYYYVYLDGYYLIPKANVYETELINVTEMIFTYKMTTFLYNSQIFGYYRLADISLYCDPDYYHTSHWYASIFAKSVLGDYNDNNYFVPTGRYDYYFITPNFSKNKLQDTSDLNLSFVFQPKEMILFKLNSKLLVNVGLGQNDDTSLVQNPILSSVDVLYKYYIDTGVFISNGNAYNRICLTYRHPTTSGQIYYQNDNGSFSALDTNSATFISMSYEVWADGNYISSNEVLVRDSKYLYQGGDSLKECFLNSLTWTNENYQFLTLTDIISNEYNKLVWLNGGADTSSYINQSGGLYDVFSLIGLAMTSWVSIFNIELMPYMTIGLFLFIPFTVGIIVLIFRMVKK